MQLELKDLYHVVFTDPRRDQRSAIVYKLDKVLEFVEWAKKKGYLAIRVYKAGLLSNGLIGSYFMEEDIIISWVKED